MICIQLDNTFDWLGIWFGISNNCGGVWSNGVRKNRETDEEHDKYCVEEGLKLARVNFNRDGETGSEAQGVGNCSVNI